jgi:predicted dehydrogenase
MTKKPLSIGIVGAENSHTISIGKVVNIEKLVKGVSVDYVWGETGEFAKKASKEGQIPNIVKDPREMIGKIDGVVVDHRHPKYHLDAALPFVEAGIPTFVDKPFCYRASKGKEFLKTARKHGTPVTSFSVNSVQPDFLTFRRKMETLGEIRGGVTYGLCDLKSKYGGIFFYGIHQVSLALDAFGFNVKFALVSKNGQNATGQLFYTDGKIVTMNLIKEGAGGFSVTAICENGTLHRTIKRARRPQTPGVKIFTKMFKTGVEPLEYSKILKPIQVLEALEKSVKSGKIERVEK